MHDADVVAGFQQVGEKGLHLDRSHVHGMRLIQ
jgi:hypothetical protein